MLPTDSGLGGWGYRCVCLPPTHACAGHQLTFDRHNTTAPLTGTTPRPPPMHPPSLAAYQLVGDPCLYTTLHHHAKKGTLTQMAFGRPAVSGGGLIMDVGCHTIDILDFLIGPILNTTGKRQ